jgi:5'-nucleotidase
VSALLERILLTNDDGIDAPGLKVLEQIARELAQEIWVVAPEHDQSGVSHAISLHHPIRISERGARRYGITGTPGDCAVMGVCQLMASAPPQLLLSGVNRGANLGIETVFSGTVGGAMTGMMLGVPSIALSQTYTDRTRLRWDTAGTLDAGVVRQLLAVGWGEATCLNVNFPDLPAEEVGTLTLARQGIGLIEGMRVETRTDPRGLSYHGSAFAAATAYKDPTATSTHCARAGSW